MSKKKEIKVDTPLTKRKKVTAVKAWFSEDDDFVNVQVDGHDYEFEEEKI